MDTPSSRLSIVKSLYLHVVALATLMMIVFSAASIISTLLKMTIFTKADTYYPVYMGEGCGGSPVSPGRTAPTPEQCEKMAERTRQAEEDNRTARQQQSLVFSISLLVVAIPLFIVHARLARREDGPSAM